MLTGGECWTGVICSLRKGKTECRKGNQEDATDWTAVTKGPHYVKSNLDDNYSSPARDWWGKQINIYAELVPMANEILVQLSG